MPATERPLPPLSENGFRGLNANEDHPTPVGTVSRAINVYLDGKRYRLRPGLVQAGSDLDTGNDVQMIAHFEELDGTPHTIAVANGSFYEYDWGADSWSGTTWASVSMTVKASGQIRWCVSRGRLVLTDGVNDPIMWDPSAPSWTTLTAAPVADYCTVYYDKVFFYGLADGNVFEWSDEGDPTSGYSASNQDWQFVQTDAGAVTGMQGLNEKMPVWKEDSIAKISGAVEENFVTDAVREGVSETEGSPSSDSIVPYDGDVYYLSREGPRMLRSGLQLVRLDIVDEQAQNVLGTLWDQYAENGIANAFGFLDKERRHIVWLISVPGATTKVRGLMYALDTGTWSEVRFENDEDYTCGSSVEDADGNELVMLGTDSGKVFIYGDAYTDDNGTAISWTVRSRKYGQSYGFSEKRICQVDLKLEVLDEGLSAAEYTGFRANVAAVIDGDPQESTRKTFNYRAAGKKRYRRGMNSTGVAVGWEVQGRSDEGLCELHAAVTRLTTSEETYSRRGQ